MAVQRDDVQRIAELARLRLEPDEVDRFTDQLNSILGHMDALSELDAEAAEAEATGGMRMHAPLRSETVPADTLVRDPSSLSEHWRAGFFVVPRLAAQDRLAEGGDASELEADDGD